MRAPKGYRRVTRGGIVCRGDMILEVNGRWVPAEAAIGDMVREYRGVARPAPRKRRKGK